jgi:hypothetical protein
MKKRVFFAGGLALLAAASASGQTKINGTLKCDKPEPRYSIEVGDRPGHAMVLEKEACTWTEALTIGSDKAKDGQSVASVDATAARASGSGIHVTTMESGDKSFSSYRYTTTLKDGKAGEAHGTWSYTGGTGKLKGIKGSGTFKTTFGEDGSTTTQVEGEYTLAEGAGAAKK